MAKPRNPQRLSTARVMFVFMEPICDDKIQRLLATAALELSAREKHAKRFDAFAHVQRLTDTQRPSITCTIAPTHACAFPVCVGDSLRWFAWGSHRNV